MCKGKKNINNLHSLKSWKKVLCSEVIASLFQEIRWGCDLIIQHINFIHR